MDLDEEMAFESALRVAHPSGWQATRVGRMLLEVRALRAENARLRAVLNRCHEAVGENADSDDETLPEGIELRIKQMLARIAEDEAELARLRAVILRTHEKYCVPCPARMWSGRHAPECLAFEVEP